MLPPLPRARQTLYPPPMKRRLAHSAPHVTLKTHSPAMKNSTSAGPKFQRLVEIMARLRAPGGCPWDREQSFDTIKPYTLEETYEVLDAIDRRDWGDLSEELGDFILQAVFYAQMAAEEDKFGIEDALDAINEKLVRRHPHVFADASAETAGDVLRQWDQIKSDEKKSKGRPENGLLAGVPRALPALVEAQQIASRAAGVGFDWENPEQVIEKLHEELAEFAAARRNGAQAELEDELGDLLFVLVNLARFVKVDPEQALRKTNAKFRERFGYIERKLAERGKSPRDVEYRGNGGAVAGSQGPVIEIRQLSTLEEFRTAVELQQTIWGFDQIELLAAAFLRRGKPRRRPSARRLRWRAHDRVLPRHSGNQAGQPALHTQPHDGCACRISQCGRGPAS